MKHPKLIANALYKAGKLPTSTCTEIKARNGSVKQTRAYFEAVVACLEKTWKKHLTGAGLSYAKVKVRHVAKFPKKWCDMETDQDDSQALYCDETRVLAVKTGKSWTSDMSDLWLFYVAAGTYAYHVQNLVGIADAYNAIPYGKRAELLEQNRRYDLQSTCLGGAFIRSVWPMKGRTSSDWNALVGAVEGDTPGDERWFGKTANQRFWLKRGFSTGDPGSCDTWSAPSSKVA
uniref:Similar to metalloprotease n=1 Tax=Nonomuraea gerenzanensis TaxID=93944 RepID=A0A1M4EQY8_9ACTN|nr:similar to metalloprotease [Nonomuraea gerenzanensis]